MAGVPPQCNEELIAAHLRADIYHDGGPSITNHPKVEKLWRPHNYLQVSGIEARVVELFNTQGPQVNREQRKQSRIDFIIRAKTDAFRSDTMSPFHPFGDAPNNQIAIIQDAGSHLFKAMHGSWNLLVPGSCIDPAGKPIHKEDNPVWVKPERNQMSIPACIFGFDSNVVGTLIWKDFKGLSVVFGFEYDGSGSDGPRSDGRRRMLWYDAGKGDIQGGTNFSSVTQPKIINKLSGFLLSNGEIEKDFKVGNPNPRIQLVIGKALGDAMQALGSVDGISTRTKWTNPTGGKRKRRTTLRKHQRGGAPPNPAFPSDGSTYGHVGPRVPSRDQIKYVILNTGDRLEGVRAEEEGAAYVYGDPIERGNPIQTLFFVPGEVGTIDTSELINQTGTRLNKVFTEMRQSFATVISEMQKTLNNPSRPGFFDPRYSVLEGTAYVTPQTTELATEFMKAAISSVMAISSAMNKYYTDEQTRIQNEFTTKTDPNEQLQFLNEEYKKWNARAGLYAPSTTSLLTKSRNIIRTHPIIALPKDVRIETNGVAGKTAERVLEGSFTIYYADALQAIKTNNRDAVRSKTPNWGPTIEPQPVEPQPVEPSMQGGDKEDYDSPETESLHAEVIAPALELLNQVIALPKVAELSCCINAFSCYLNKHNISRFKVEPVYEFPTPEEIQAIQSGNVDTYSTAAYYAVLEEAYLKMIPTIQLPRLPFNIVSEFTGPLSLFAQYRNVSINEAAVIFAQVDKNKCIDETLYEQIYEDIRFVMADSVPFVEDVMMTSSSVEVPMTQEVTESKENDDLSGYETAANENEFGREQESKEESMNPAIVPPPKPMFMKNQIFRTTSEPLKSIPDIPMVPREPMKRRRGSDFMSMSRRLEPETKQTRVLGGRTFRRRLPKLI